MSEMQNEEWLVQLASGDVRLMTLEELDAAFQEGLVDESTLVRRDGASKWHRLVDELAAAEQAQPEPAPASLPAPRSSASSSLQAVVTPSEAPVVASNVSLPELDDELHAVMRRSRKRTLIASSVIATAVIGVFATVTAVNVVRMQKHAAVMTDVAPPLRVTAPSDPEPEMKVHDDAKTKRDRNVRRNKANGSGATTDQAPDMTKTPFHSGGDDHDPLNAKL